MTKIYNVGSLFAGVGGVCLGFQNAKVENIDSKYNLVWANEMDEYACETYRTNFKHTLLEGDINKILNPGLCDEFKIKIENIKLLIKKYNEEKEVVSDINKKEFCLLLEEEERKLDFLEKERALNIENIKKEIEYYNTLKEKILSKPIDILLGGFPCQAFSIAGEQKGFEDDRGNLFLSIIELINQLNEKYKKPRILFLENVKNLKSHDKGRTYQVIKSELEKTGYIVKEHILNTMTYSELPQNRERIYIIGFLNKSDAEKFDLFDKLDKFKNGKTSIDRVSDIKKVIDYSITKDVGEKYYYTKEKYPNYFLSKEEYENIPEVERKSERVNLDEQITEMYQFYQVRRGMYVRKNKSGVCPTLTANMGTGGHNVPIIKVNDGIRKLTPKETFKLQGFPVGKGYVLPEKYKGKAYSDARLYKQAGNAVSVPVIKFLAEELLKILE